MTLLCARVRLLDYIGVEHAVLFEIMGNSVLRQKRRLEADFGADPFAFLVRLIERVVAASATAELRAEVGALDLVELLQFAPGFIASRARNVDFQSYCRHSRRTF